ncbi:hypothetical protein C2W62_39445 [Candidatus Entotheonella serta]|nr:hypothetical protein C2W62_39445 [Candidatus Entotheonella serta]
MWIPITAINSIGAILVYWLKCTCRCQTRVEVTLKELKGGLHLGQMQVRRDADRVARSVALSVCAYLLLVRLYGRDAKSGQPWSLFRLKQRFQADPDAK